MKKNALLVMAATGDYLFAVANVLIGLKKHSPKAFDDIVVYTDATASEKDLKAIKKIFPVIFKQYTYQIPNFEDRERLKYYSNMPYSRFEMLDYLNEYKKVVWFDSDFLITGDISGLLEYGKTGFSMAKDPVGVEVRNYFVKDIPGYRMEGVDAFASGLVIFSDALANPKEKKKYLYNQLEKYSSYIRYAEQGILHLMIEDYQLTVEAFPKNIYHCFPSENKKDAKIIHLLGNSKPWKIYCGDCYDEWYENYEEWLKLGGTDPSHLEELKINSSQKDIRKLLPTFPNYPRLKASIYFLKSLLFIWKRKKYKKKLRFYKNVIAIKKK